MSYIKYGIVTKIKLINSNSRTIKFIDNNFNLDIYTKNNNTYYLKDKILEENLALFRDEMIKLMDKSCDSLNNCEAYCLETDVNKMLESKIELCNENEKYYFNDNKNLKFDTDVVVITERSIKIKLYLIPIFWDINRAEFENYINIASFISKLIRTSTQNILKDASFLVVV